MNQNNRLIAKNSLILFFRLIITSLFSLVSTRLVINSLGASDYGLYAVIGGIVILLVFFNTVMTSSTYRFIAYEMGTNNINGVNKIFNISLVIHLFIAILIILFVETFGVYYVNNYLNVDAGKISDAIFILRLSTYTTIINVISIPHQGLLVAKENFLTTAKIEIIRSVLSLLVAIMLVYYGGNKLRFYVVFISIINVVPSILFIVYCKKHYATLIKWSLQDDKAKYFEILNFSGWIMMGAASNMAKNSGSALVLNNFFGTVLNASFGIANQINNVVQMFPSSLGQAAIPQITKSFSGGNSERTVNLTVYLSKYIFFLMLIPAIPMLLETEFILRLWLGNLPPYTVVFVRLMIANAMLESLGGVGAIAQAAGKIKYFQLTLSVLSIISLPIAYVCFRLGFQPPSIIITYIATSTINLAMSLYLLKKILNFNIKFYLKTVHLRVFSVLLLVSGVFILKEFLIPGWFRFLLLTSVSLIWVIIIIYKVGLEKYEKEAINESLRRIILTNNR